MEGSVESRTSMEPGSSKSDAIAAPFAAPLVPSVSTSLSPLHTFENMDGPVWITKKHDIQLMEQEIPMDQQIAVPKGPAVEEAVYPHPLGPVDGRGTLTELVRTALEREEDNKGMPEAVEAQQVDETTAAAAVLGMSAADMIVPEEREGVQREGGGSADVPLVEEREEDGQREGEAEGASPPQGKDEQAGGEGVHENGAAEALQGGEHDPMDIADMAVGSTEPTSESSPAHGSLSSATLEKAEEDFLAIMESLSDEADVVNFIGYVEETLRTQFRLSIFDAPVIDKLRTRLSSGISTPKTRPAKPDLLPREKHPPLLADRRPKPRPKAPAPKKSKKRATDPYGLLHSPESMLTQVNLKDVVNWRTFNTFLSPGEKDELMKHLPGVDKFSPDSLRTMFSSPQFISYMPIFQTMLEAGEFDTAADDDYRRYLKGKHQREHVDPWKEKYFEEYWGEKLSVEQAEQPPGFSFVQLAATAAKSENSKRMVPNGSLRASTDGQHPVQNATTNTTTSTTTSKSTTHNTKKRLSRDLSEDDSDFGDEPSDTPSPKRKTKKAKAESSKVEPDADEYVDGGEAIGERHPFPLRLSGNQWLDCAQTLLKRVGKPMNALKMVEMGIAEGMLRTTGKTPQNSLAAAIYSEIKNDSKSIFRKESPMVFALKEFPRSKK